MKKLLSKITVKGILKLIPFVGEIVTNIDAQNGDEKGKINIAELFQSLFRLILLIAFLRGVINPEEIKSILKIF